ncbi:unnamed protein product [Paramecium pentaurelia]|uniref:B30.2/SPRY domain-containing protein n=1 Tax=Paramecium pentaurelia TaxID=43138 RepID=A0A8S1XBJ3_9CILI|nr:unnamed protein product [Paramecium pentaurelia]
MDQSQGFERSRFINYNSDSFDCGICQRVPRDPNECADCGQIYCASCLDQQQPLKCVCGKINLIQKIQGALKKIYDELELKCQFCQNGIKLNQIQSHEAGCDKKCINYEFCGHLVPKENNDKICDTLCKFLHLINKANKKQEIYQYLRDLPIQNIVIQEKNIKSIDSPLNQIGSIIWDKKRMGVGINLSDSDQKAFLDDQAHTFKTVIAKYGFEQGIVYWEIKVDKRTENELKIGVTNKRDFNYDQAFCDFEYGWAYYGLAQLRHNSNANGPTYGKKFKNDGEIGVCLNMNQGTLMFSLNGEFLGCAFKDEKLKVGPIYPAVALLNYAGCKITSGKPVPQIFQQ